ncbi:unnamed protein product [Paramecium octaurelia]|uniref:Uncharacterized protein n=1 Tax=Paramecium octaurelia TaxID=43137 RepID=A0A8S1T2R4_PAROT|nr:unnamed protein product [Paramecium octaurelia]
MAIIGSNQEIKKETQEQSIEQREEFLDSIFREEFQSLGTVLKPRQNYFLLVLLWSQEKITMFWSSILVGTHDLKSNLYKSDCFMDDKQANKDKQIQFGNLILEII